MPEILYICPRFTHPATRPADTVSGRKTSSKEAIPEEAPLPFDAFRKGTPPEMPDTKRENKPFI